MLYDPKWEAPTKINLFTLPSLIAWLEKQPPRARYDFWDCEGKCLLDRYVAGIGLRRTYSNYTKASAFGSEIACTKPWTFGAALKRAREELTSTMCKT
jgi:hypothetical protein